MYINTMQNTNIDTNTLAGFKDYQNLDVKFGNKKKMTQFAFRFKKSRSKAQIKKTVSELVQMINTAQTNKGVPVGGRVLINTLYDDLWWRSGKMTRFGENIHLFDPDDEYTFEGEKFQSTFKAFNIIVETHPLTGGCTNGKNNCLWGCLFRHFGGEEQMPGCIRKPWNLKKLCKVGTNDPVPVKAVVEILQPKLKHRIDIVGDHTEYSTAQYMKGLMLVLENGHYSLKRTNRLTPSFHHKSAKAASAKANPTEVATASKKIVLYWNHADGMHCYYYNHSTAKGVLRALPLEKLMRFVKDKGSTQKMYHQLNFSPKPFDHTGLSESDLKQLYDDHVAGCSWLCDKTNGQLDMRLHPSPTAAAVYRFDRLKKVAAPEPIEYAEARWLLYGSHGGVRYAEPCELDDGVEYDFTSFYTWLMQSSATFPVKPGVPATLEALKPDWIEYGLYRCEVTRPADPTVAKLFNFRSNNIYTHYDLAVAQKLGLVITMDCSRADEPNALLYPKSTRVPMRDAFKDSCAPLFKLKSLPGAPKIVKRVLNSLWGGLCEKTKVREIVPVLSEGSHVDGGIEHLLSANLNEPSVPGEHNHHELLSIEPVKGGKYNVRLRDYRKPFKHDWARLGPFLTGLGRKRMFDTFHGHEEAVRWVHTDGAVLTGPIGLKDHIKRNTTCVRGRMTITNGNHKTIHT